MKKIITILLFANTLQIQAQCWAKVSAGGQGHSLGLKNEKSLWTWGANFSGELGNGSAMTANSPNSTNSNLTQWLDVSAGTKFSLGLQYINQTVYAWGENTKGQLGIGTFSNMNTPTQININAVQYISAGETHALARKNDGTIWAWGENTNGQLGNGTANTSTNAPSQVGTATNWKLISAGTNHSLATDINDNLWVWGANTYGQLGDGTNTDRNIPVMISPSFYWKSISAGYWFTLGIKTDGTLWSWGTSIGALGNGTVTITNSPMQIGTANDWKEVAAGDFHSLALKTNVTLWAWGSNTNGQLGNGNNLNTSSPIQIGTDQDWMTLDGGYDHSLAIKTDGTLWAWGANANGQLGDGTTTDKNAPTLITCPFVGIKEISSENKFYSIYPNPATNILYIKNSINKSIEGISILDFTGRKILEQKGNTTEINISSIEQGMYQLVLTSEGNTYSSKLIKQ